MDRNAISIDNFEIIVPYDRVDDQLGIINCTLSDYLNSCTETGTEDRKNHRVWFVDEPKRVLLFLDMMGYDVLVDRYPVDT